MNAFNEKERKIIENKMLKEGFTLLKEGGLKNVNIDTITKKCFISKGSFYSFFPNKSEFIYAIMIYKRNEAKKKLDYFAKKGKLDFTALYNYLAWLVHADVNIFTYLSKKEQKNLIKSWPPEYLNNNSKNNNTLEMLLSHLYKPKDNPDKELFCNYMKLIAISSCEKNIFIQSSFNEMIDKNIIEACLCISDK